MIPFFFKLQCGNNKIWSRAEVIVDDVFAYSIKNDLMNDDYDSEPRSVIDCKQRNVCPKWQEVMKSKLASIEIRKFFGHIAQTPDNIKLVCHKWIFVKKRNKNNEMVRYKARLVVQGFSQIRIVVSCKG